jgi:hypothetical protein
MTARFHRPTPTRALGLALLVAASACDGGSDPTPAGPLATLGGELRQADGGAAPGPLRLALAWYPGLMSSEGRPMSQPRAIATQDVAYDGALPLAYAFHVAAAPPAAALQPMPEGYAGRGALGILLAYQDGNGNRRLDTIPADGAPVDHVVGASLDWAAAPAYVVAYLTDDQPAATGLKAGFNLLEIADAEDTAVVPLGTPVPMAISEGGALLDLFVCEAAWDGSSTQAPCGLDLGEGEVLDAAVTGEVYVGVLAGEAAFALFEVVGGERVRISDATVTLDGVAIPYEPESGYYYSFQLDVGTFAEPRTVELVATRGEAVLRREIEIPAFDFTDVPATVETGTAFDIAWSVPASAESFDLYLDTGSEDYIMAYGLDASPYHVTPLDVLGEAWVTVAAHAAIESEIPVTVVRSTTVTYVPAPAP